MHVKKDVRVNLARYINGDELIPPISLCPALSFLSPRSSPPPPPVTHSRPHYARPLTQSQNTTLPVSDHYCCLPFLFWFRLVRVSFHRAFIASSCGRPQITFLLLSIYQYDRLNEPWKSRPARCLRKPPATYPISCSMAHPRRDTYICIYKGRRCTDSSVDRMNRRRKETNRDLASWPVWLSLWSREVVKLLSPSSVHVCIVHTVTVKSFRPFSSLCRYRMTYLRIQWVEINITGADGIVNFASICTVMDMSANFQLRIIDQSSNFRVAWDSEVPKLRCSKIRWRCMYGYYMYVRMRGVWNLCMDSENLIYPDIILLLYAH